jgi:hypothetical protein
MKASTDQAGKTNQAKQTLAAVDDSYAGGTVSAAFFFLVPPHRADMRRYVGGSVTIWRSMLPVLGGRKRRGRQLSESEAVVAGKMAGI